MSELIEIDDCWNRIGVQGDKSCPLLIDHVHCRNCHVYEAAALTLMNRSLPEAYSQDWARQFSLQQAEEVACTASSIVFRIGDEWFGLPTGLVTEVAELRAIHTIPHRQAAALAGLTNLRGELLICISLAALLETGSQPAAEESASAAARSRLLVVSHEGFRVGFPVDAMHGVERYHPGQLGSLPATLAMSSRVYCSAVLSLGDRVVGCLDPELLFKSISRSIA